MKKITSHIWTIALCTLISGLSSCHKFLTAPEPLGLTTGDQVWNSDSLTASVLNTALSALANGEIFDGNTGASIEFGLYTDDLMPVLDTLGLFPEYHCTISAGSTFIETYWEDFYRQIYACNAVIAGAGSSTTSTTLVHRNQWLGEAYFLRALQYFYLTNIYGAVPLALSTNYTTNNSLSCSPQNAVYGQIVSDLNMALTLLDDTYHDGNGNPTADRGRPNRSAAEALLARVYLYQTDWPDAETAATTVLGDAQYSLVALTQTFQANSAEAIWQLAPSSGAIEDFYFLFNQAPPILPPNTPLTQYATFKLTDSLVNAFEPGDARYTQWVQTVTSTTPAQTFYLAAKYTSAAPEAQYIMMSRLAELYLIRSEARAHQGNTTGALNDLNTIRQRAHLTPLNLTDATALLSAIAHENRIEFFAEEAHRFFDLRRTGMLDAVETADETFKNSTWQSYKQYWPIPPSEIANNPNLTQTPGY